MDRLNQLRGAAGGSGDSTLDTSSPPSEAYLSANDSQSKYFSLSEVDSSFDISPIKDVSLSQASVESETTITGDELLPNLSPIPKKSEMLDGYKIGKQIEAANILSGGVDIFDDNDNSYDGDELVIDDNVELDEKSNSELKQPDSTTMESTLVEEASVASKDTEVVLQIDGKNVDAIDIGNGLYLYRKEGEEELAAIQIIDDDRQQPSFKFLKVRENAEGNLEVYEEIEIEVPKEVPTKEINSGDKNTTHVPIRDINKVINDTISNKVADKNKAPEEVLQTTTTLSCDVECELKDGPECKSEVNLNGKMKFSESRKSPVIGSFTYHSTPNKEGRPLTKTMVDLQLHPSRHSDNVKKTIEVHTDSCKQKSVENDIKTKDLSEEKVSDNLCKRKDDSPVLIEGKNEENLHAEKIIKENAINEVYAKDIVVDEINKTDKIKPKTNEYLEKTDQNINDDVQKSDNKVKIDLQDSSRNIDKIEVSESNNDNISSNDQNQKSSISNIELDNNLIKHNISKEDVKTSEVNDVTDLELLKNENSEKQLFSQIDQIKDKNKQDNVVSQIEKQTSDDILNDKVVVIENCIDNDEKSLVPKDNKTILKLNKEEIIKENNIILPDTDANRIKNILEDTKKLQDTVTDDNKKSTIDSCTDYANILATNISNNLASNMKSSTLGNNTENEYKDINVDESLKSNELRLEATEIIIESEKKVVEPNIDYKNIESKPVKDELVNHKELNKKQSQQNFSEKEHGINETLEMKSVNESKQKIEQKIDQKIIKLSIQPDQPSKEIGSTKNDILKTEDEKSVNDNSAVPFGKWTEANRQEFLIKIKGFKPQVINSNNKSLKSSNDLNRRDILKKIDSQRQSNSTASKIQELNKMNNKTETAFINKSTAANVNDAEIPNTALSHKSKVPTKIGTSTAKTEQASLKLPAKHDTERKTLVIPTKVTATVTGATKKESVQRKVVKDLIDKTIEGMINKAFPSKSASTETMTNSLQDSEGKIHTTNPPTTLDAIEMKMNELHGIPFIERPPHELPKVHNPVSKSINPVQNKVTDKKPSKIPNLLLFTNKNSKKAVNDTALDADSEEELIEHEPVTGDAEIKQDLPSNLSLNEKSITKPDIFTLNKDNTKKESIITEKDFDKFARRNSVAYENCLTVNFEEKESHNVVTTVVEIEKSPIKSNKSEISQIGSNHKLPVKYQHLPQNIQSYKNNTIKLGANIEDPSNNKYQSKVQMAYQSALACKRPLSRPNTIIEDQPVKVVFMDAKTDFVPNLLNVQGQELAPSKKQNTDDTINSSATDSMDSDIMGTIDDCKLQDETKQKTKHQRKQVLTPVETPELELIEPSDLGIEVSPKKKRKTEDIKLEKNSKNVIHKKSYLLGRTGIEDKIHKTQNHTNNELKTTTKRDEDISSSKNAVTALDSLVIAAELLENQAENINTSTASNLETSQNTTPVKRGRGRPRKYPIPDGAIDKSKESSPQKKPRLIDAKPSKQEIATEDEDSTDDGIVKENWTMGKINENIVCPICNKLFRSENVVFKHVKHCTGPSPNRSDASKRSAGRDRDSQESDEKSQDSQDEMELDEDNTCDNRKEMHYKSNFKDSVNKSRVDQKPIVTADIITKEKPKKHDNERHVPRLSMKNKSLNNHECNYCGKTFRQLSYLVHHKSQHKEEDAQIMENNPVRRDKSVFNCEICKKVFRKLHHLVQHRIIHNQNAVPTKSLRKNSTDKTNNPENQEIKQSEDPSAGFRCEPCDKSFRKLHHLVEHRETHDGINRQKVTCPEQAISEKPTPPPQCDLCKKTFRKLHHLIEHKEQHAESSSEKSDDKSVKSSLSTKDIIHECSLCYMVFPNEHSLNKHTVICQRKKRQSKQPKPVNEEENVTPDAGKLEENKSDDGEEPEIILDEVKIINLDKDESINEPDTHSLDTALLETNTTESKNVENSPTKGVEVEQIKTKEESITIDEVPTNVTKVSTAQKLNSEITEKDTKIDETELDTIKGNIKKILPKNKVTPVVTKRKKSFNVTLPTVNENKPVVESSDDDEVRYMLNPDYKPEDVTVDKLFMKVRAKKRNSLQIERPNSKELIKRRISLQHPPKIPRLKPKPIEAKVIPSTLKNIPKIPKLESIPSTDSDDSDVKYSFPVKKIAEKTPKVAQERPQKEEERRSQRKSLEDKRKTLSGIAKRKSLGKPIGRRISMKPSPAKPGRKRAVAVEHRCDCGQLFSSAALLSRHTSQDHTPPRIRKRRSPPPEIEVKVTAKPTHRPPQKTKPGATRISSARSDASSLNAKATKVAEGKSSRKSIKQNEKTEIVSPKSIVGKPRRIAHKGVPVPEKMRKLKEKGVI